MMKNKKISHIEIYYKDSSMDRISNEEKTDKKLTAKQRDWLIEQNITDLNSCKNCSMTDKKVTLENYKEFDEDVFSDMPHSWYKMVISLLDTLK